MQLPTELTRKIEDLTESIGPAQLARAAAELTSEYRRERKTRPELDRIHRAAYLITRLPATYAVVDRILRECKFRTPDLRIETMLDLGAGPGTAMWATAQNFPELARVTLVELSPEWIATGQQLACGAEREAVRLADWKQARVSDTLPADKFDLVVLSYALNELRPNESLAVAKAAWQRTGKVLLIAEPGTPAAFQHVREVRQEIISAGAHILAPCPHASVCPMPTDDWCHFGQRLPRTTEHRRAKGADLGYEDEKYSYVVFARSPARLPTARILRHVRKHSGHVELELCTTEGLKRETISRKQGDRYKLARKAEWGDAVDWP